MAERSKQAGGVPMPPAPKIRVRPLSWSKGNTTVLAQFRARLAL